MLKTVLKNTLKMGCYSLSLLGGKPEIPVLVYHSIDDTGSVLSVAPETLRRQFRLFKSCGFETLSLDEYFQCKREKRVPKNKFLITFDDGFRNLHSHALPILKEFSYSAVVFLVTDYIGKNASWILRDEQTIIDRLIPNISWTEEQLNAEISRLREMAGYPLLTWEEIEEMAQEGIEFHSHSHTHPFISTLNAEELKSELAQSKTIVEDRLQKKMGGFCYPYSDYQNPEVARLLSETDYQGAFVGDFADEVRQEHRRFFISRVPVWEHTSDFEFKFFFSSGYPLYRTIVKNVKKRRSGSG